MIDYTAEAERPGSGCGDVRGKLLQYVGTRYDPVVASHFEALLDDESSAGGDCGRLTVPIASLAEGMTLAEDLHTAGGVKLLSRGTKLTRSTLDAIQQRHRFDPILHGAVVHKK